MYYSSYLTRIKKITSSVLLAFVISTGFVFAQEEPPLLFETVEQPVGTVSCFDYYTFNSVGIQISNEVESALPGVEQTFSVEMTNQNPYPLVDGKLYVKVFREREDNVDTQINGDHVVDSFVVFEDVTLPAEGVVNAAFNWTPSQYLPAGNYYMATYFITSDRFNLSGLSFTDDIIGGRGDFKVVTDNQGLYFDKDSVTINGDPHQFIAAVPQFPKYERLVVTAPVKNDTLEAMNVGVTWNIYYWDAQREEQLVETVEGAAFVPASGVTDVSYELKDYQHAVYLIEPVITYRNETVSKLNVRVARTGIDFPRINFPAVTSFPLKGGEESTLFSCLHNGGSNALVTDTVMTLELKDEVGNVIHTYTYEGGTTGDMMAIAESFTPEMDYNAVSLTATLSHQGGLVDTVTVAYDCEEIDPNSCVESSEESSIFGDMFHLLTTVLGAVAGVLVVTALVVGFAMLRRRKTLDPNEEFEN